jgi:hypothetical protein
MAQRKIRSTFAGLVFGPHDIRVPTIPAEFLKNAEDDTLRDRLFVRELSLPQACRDVGESDFE